MSKNDEAINLAKIINKEMKDEGLLRLGGDKSDVDVISSGSIALDHAIGVGGYPRGRIAEIYGPEASGKTTVCLTAIKQVQNAGGRCAFLDMEHALDPKLARGCGVDWDSLLFAQPQYGEQCFTVAQKIIESGKVDLVVVDSVAALIPEAEVDGEMEDTQMGAQARMMGKGIRKVVAALNKSKCVLIFVNQIREKIGVMFGNPETTPGGRALRFASSIRLDVRRKEAITKNSKIIGNHLRVKVVKNKVAPPHGIADVVLMFGKGVDNSKDIVDIGVDLGIVIKKGSGHFSYDNVKANGIDNFVNNLYDEDKMNILEKEVREKMVNDSPIIVDQKEDELVVAEDSGFDDE